MAAAKGFSAGPLRYPVPTRLKVAGLMNYVYERDYAVLVRLKVPAGMRWPSADPRRRAVACLHGQDLRSGAGRVCAGPAGRQRHAQACSVQRMAACVAAAAGDAWAFSVEGDKLRVAIPLPANVEVREPYIFPITDKAVDYEAPQSFRRAGDWVVAELP